MTKPNDTVFIAGPSGVCGTLTKREYFAAMALIGISTNPHGNSCEEVANWAIRYADATIKALNKEEQL